MRVIIVSFPIIRRTDRPISNALRTIRDRLLRSPNIELVAGRHPPNHYEDHYTINESVFLLNGTDYISLVFETIAFPLANTEDGKQQYHITKQDMIIFTPDNQDVVPQINDILRQIEYNNIYIGDNKFIERFIIQSNPTCAVTMDLYLLQEHLIWREDVITVARGNAARGNGAAAAAAAAVDLPRTGLPVAPRRRRLPQLPTNHNSPAPILESGTRRPIKLSSNNNSNLEPFSFTNAPIREISKSKKKSGGSRKKYRSQKKRITRKRKTRKVKRTRKNKTRRRKRR